MNPLRSISVVPSLYANQGNMKPFYVDTYEDNDKHIQNYQAFSTEMVDETDISWLTDIPDEKMYVEVSFKDKSTGNYVSRKFDFGNFLRYVGNAFRILEKGINGVYLTKEEANTLYYPITGGQLKGPMQIVYSGKAGNALEVNAKDSLGEQAAVAFYSKLIVSEEGNEATVEGNKITVNKVDTDELTASSATITNMSAATLTSETSTFSGKSTFNDESTFNANAYVKLDAANKITLNTDGTITAAASDIGSLSVTTAVEFGDNVSVVVKKDLTVDGDTTLGALDVTGEANFKNKVYLKNTSDDTDTITITMDNSVGSITSPIVQTNSSGNIKMDDSGFHAPNVISDIIAKKACWA